MNTLIVYYSFTQNNELLAKQLQRRLGADTFKIETLRKRVSFSIFLDLLFKRKPAIRKHQLRLQGYDHLVFVAPIWAGQIAAPLKTFLFEEKQNIARYSFITLCGGAPGQQEKVERELTALVMCAPEKVTELRISDLFLNKEEKSAGNISGYRIQALDWQVYTSKINDFCNSVQRELVT